MRFRAVSTGGVCAQTREPLTTLHVLVLLLLAAGYASSDTGAAVNERGEGTVIGEQ